MSIETLALAIQTLAPASVSHLYTSFSSVQFVYVDGTKDSVEIEISILESPGDEIIISCNKGTVWYFAPEFCHWLAMCSRLIADFREEAKKNEPF